jgi:hypothetical protein
MQSISQMCKIIHVCVNGQLTSEEKQKIRDAHAFIKGENQNQPEWTNTNYLEMLVESVFALGCLTGKQRGNRIAYKEFEEAMERMKVRYEQTIFKVAKDAVKVAFDTVMSKK